jgi:hypothetical protein
MAKIRNQLVYGSASGGPGVDDRIIQGPGSDAAVVTRINRRQVGSRPAATTQNVLPASPAAKPMHSDERLRSRIILQGNGGHL